MSRFLMDRGIFENPIWNDLPTFRLFFYLVGKAAYKDGIKTGKIELKRGQYIRSYRKLQEDLAFVENHSQKTYSTSTLKRCVDQLIKDQRIFIEECELGTLFTVLNYEQYQVFPGLENGSLEHCANTDRTLPEQIPNNKNKRITKDNEVIPPIPPTGGKKIKSPKTMVADDWLPSESFSTWLRENHPTVNEFELARELGKFKSYCKANGKKYADHDAALRNWFDSPFRKSGYTTQAQQKGSQISASGIKLAHERAGGYGPL